MQTGSTVSPQVREKACEVFFVDTVRKRGESHLSAKFENRYIYKKYLSECSSVSTPNVINYVQNLYWGADTTPPPKKYGIQVTSSFAEYKAGDIWKKAVKKAQEEVNKSLPGPDDPDANEAEMFEIDSKLTKDDLAEEDYRTSELTKDELQYYCDADRRGYDWYTSRPQEINSLSKEHRIDEVKTARFLMERCKGTGKEISPQEFKIYKNLILNYK